MSIRPVIFISAVSKELHTARDLVAKTLVALGYEPRWQDIAATDTGDLRGVLRKWIDDSDAVLQLVGHCYGFAPMTLDRDFGACSYTQYEALYARQQGKPVYYLFIDDPHPTDGCGCESQSLHDLQEQYRRQVKAHGDLYHNTSSLTQTELLVRRLKDDLANLRKRSKQHAVVVLVLLVLCVLSVLWLLHGHQKDSKDLNDTKEAASKTEKKVDVLLQANADLRQMFETSIKGGSEQKLASDYDAALRFIAHKRGIGLDAFRAFLDQNATQALGDPGTSLKDKVRALQEAGQFVQARDFALDQARRLETERQKPSKEEIELWTEVAKTEFTLGHYDKALEYATKAANHTGRLADFSTWSAARHQQGRALRWLRKDKEAQALYEELIPLQLAAFGPDDPSFLESRNILADAIHGQGNLALAEQQERSLLADCQRLLGSEHPITLNSRDSLALALNDQGKYAEAEQEHRAVLKVQERVMGAEHPDTLTSRNNLAVVLDTQGKNAEAEQEHRTVLKQIERVLGVEHPDVAQSCYNLASCLEAQQKLPEAIAFMQRAEHVFTKALGSDHPDTKRTKAAREDIEATLSKSKPAPSPDAPANSERGAKSAEPPRDREMDRKLEMDVRDVLARQTAIYGPEHQATLFRRMDLAIVLDDAGKYAESEKEFRAVLKDQERVLGAEHHDVLQTCFNFGHCLEHQNKLPEALALAQRVEQVHLKNLGPSNPSTKSARTERERIEALMKK